MLILACLYLTSVAAAIASTTSLQQGIMAAADEFKASYIAKCEDKNVKPRDELLAVLNTAAATG